jgi:hypothetical protein
MSHLKISESTSTLGMDDTLGNSLTIKVSNFIDIVDVLKKDGSSRSNSLTRCLNSNRCTSSNCCYAWAILMNLKYFIKIPYCTFSVLFILHSETSSKNISLRAWKCILTSRLKCVSVNYLPITLLKSIQQNRMNDVCS